MDIYSALRFPGLSGKKTILFSLILGIVFCSMPFFGLSLNKTRNDLTYEEASLLQEERLLVFGKNTLISKLNPANPEAKVVQKLPVVVTAYSSTVGQTDNDPFITAAGTWVRDGIIANNYLPFGTKVRIPELYGDKVFTVEDRMSWKKGNYHIDIWFPSYLEAKEFGAKRTYIEVLES